MPLSYIFWAIMLLWLFFGGWHYYGSGWNSAIGGLTIPFFAVAILGWKVFGSAVKDG